MSSVRGVVFPAQNSLAFFKVQRLPLPLFRFAVVARDTIDLNGNNSVSDSFDSSDPNFSVNGLYSASLRRDHGDVAVNSSILNSLIVGNTSIYGSVYTGPKGSVAIGVNGSVGDMAWHNSGNGGIEPGFDRNDLNVNYPDVQAPFNGGAFTPYGTSGSITNSSSTVTYYDYILDNGNYQSATLNGSLYVRGDAVLYVTSSATLSGIVIQPGKSLRLYSSAPSVVLGGNDNGLASGFFYWGMPGNTSLTIGGNGDFTGTVYAPNAALTMNGGGSNTIDFMGASITKSVKMNSHFNFHYDEALARIGPFL